MLQYKIRKFKKESIENWTPKLDSQKSQIIEQPNRSYKKSKIKWLKEKVENIRKKKPNLHIWEKNYRIHKTRKNY